MIDVIAHSHSQFSKTAVIPSRARKEAVSR